MARIGTLRETFDRDMDFVAVKPLKFNGRVFSPGQGFDKAAVTQRLLRQLYEGRYLSMVKPKEQVARVERPPVVLDIRPNFEPEQAQKPPRIKRVKSSRQ